MAPPTRAARSRALVLLLGVAATPSAGAQELTIPQVVRAAGPSVVFLRTLDAAGRQVTLGSGFVAPDGRIVTSGHVVAGGARVEVTGPDGERLGSVAFVEAFDRHADLAVLPGVPGLPAGLAVAETAPEVGEGVVVIGSPEGFANTVSEGIVSAFRTVDGQRLMQISAPISHGSSGGPVLDRRGRVVGVTVAVWSGGQNLNFAVPLEALRALLGAEPERVALSAVPAVTAPAGASSRRGGRFLRLSVPVRDAGVACADPEP
jgi:S1-C subfamily serine protease